MSKCYTGRGLGIISSVTSYPFPSPILNTLEMEYILITTVSKVVVVRGWGLAEMEDGQRVHDE